jgi:hypothetical protein
MITYQALTIGAFLCVIAADNLKSTWASRILSTGFLLLNMLHPPRQAMIPKKHLHEKRKLPYRYPFVSSRSYPGLRFSLCISSAAGGTDQPRYVIVTNKQRMLLFMNQPALFYVCRQGPFLVFVLVFAKSTFSFSGLCCSTP